MKDWLVATAIRALKTFAETLLGFVVIGNAFSEIDWAYAFSVAGVAAFGAVLWAIKGLPEVNNGDSIFKLEEKQ